MRNPFAWYGEATEAQRRARRLRHIQAEQQGRTAEALALHIEPAPLDPAALVRRPQGDVDAEAEVVGVVPDTPLQRLFAQVDREFAEEN